LGDPKKRRRKFETPRHPWRRDQLDAELKIVAKYGLRNKRELWRYRFMLSKIRRIARSLLGEKEKAKIESEYIQKLGRLSIMPVDATLDNVLDLDIEDLLERRLQTVAFRAGLAKSIHQARQMVSHGHIAVGGRVVSVPSYLVLRDEEPLVGYAAQSPLVKPDHPIKKTFEVKAASGKAEDMVEKEEDSS